MDLTVQPGERGFDARSLAGHEFTGPSLIHVHLLAGPPGCSPGSGLMMRRFGDG